VDGYRLLLGSDITRDGIGLELYDSTDTLLVDVFEVNDDRTSRVLWVWSRVELSLAGPFGGSSVPPMAP
jgi:hypothetical protein